MQHSRLASERLVPRDGHGELGTGGNPQHAHLQQGLDHTRDEALVLVSMPQLPGSACVSCTTLSCIVRVIIQVLRGRLAHSEYGAARLRGLQHMHMQTFQPQKPAPYTCGVSQISALHPRYLQHSSKACTDFVKETPPAPKVSTCFECPWQPQCVPPGPRNLAQLTCTDLTSPNSHEFHHPTSLSRRQTRAAPAPKVSTRPWVSTAAPKCPPRAPVTWVSW